MQRHSPNGFATLELLIAFAILSLSLTAVIVVAFGNQSFALDTTLAQRALSHTKSNLEAATASALSSFGTLTASPPTSNGTFTEQVNVYDISECAKRIESKSTWTQGLRNLDTTLSNVVVDTETSALLGHSCATTEPFGDWDTPHTLDGFSPPDFDGQGTGVAVMDINSNKFAFLTTDESHHTRFNFYSIDVSSPDTVSSDDITSLHMGGNGLNGIAVATIDAGTFAFVLNDSTTNQLSVIDVSDPESPFAVVGADRSLPFLTNGIPRSIFYYDERLYIGTQYVPCTDCTLEQNNELHIFDVSDPTNPSWVNSIDVDRNINAIYVTDGKAYLATGPGTSAPYTPLRVYSIDPLDSDYLDEVNSFSVAQSRQGTAVSVLGSTIYLGMESKSTSDHDLYLLDKTNLTIKGSHGLNGNNSQVNEVRVLGRFAFVGLAGGNSQDTLQIWDISDPATAWRANTCTAGNPFPQNITGLVFSDNFLFASFRSNETFRIIQDTPEVCSP